MASIQQVDEAGALALPCVRVLYLGAGGEAGRGSEREPGGGGWRVDNRRCSSTKGRSSK